MLDFWGCNPLAYEWLQGESRDMWVRECGSCFYAFNENCRLDEHQKSLLVVFSHL